MASVLFVTGICGSLQRKTVCVTSAGKCLMWDELDEDILEFGSDEDVQELMVKKAIGQRIREKQGEQNA